MKVHTLTVAEYQHIAHDDAFDCTETMMLAGTWPVSIGKHPAFPGNLILIGHVQDRAFLVTLDEEPTSAM